MTIDQQIAGMIDRCGVIEDGPTLWHIRQAARRERLQLEQLLKDIEKSHDRPRDDLPPPIII